MCYGLTNGSCDSKTHLQPIVISDVEMCFSVDVFLSCGIVFFFLKSYYIELLELRDSVIYDCHSLRALVSYYSSVLTRCPP